MKKLVVHVFLVSLQVAILQGAYAVNERGIYVFGSSLVVMEETRFVDEQVPVDALLRENLGEHPIAMSHFASLMGVELTPDERATPDTYGINFASKNALASQNGEHHLDGQIERYLEIYEISNKSPDALYVLMIGAEDVMAAIKTSRREEARQIIEEGIQAIRNSVQKLVNSGAENFLIGNVPDVGVLSPSLLQDKLKSTKNNATLLTTLFNLNLNRMLNELAMDESITIHRFDFFKFLSMSIYKESKQESDVPFAIQAQNDLAEAFFQMVN